MNRLCPYCEMDLTVTMLETETVVHNGESWVAIEEVQLDLVPYDEKQRPENWGDEPGPIGGLWFCSPECRDAYKAEEAEA